MKSMKLMGSIIASAILLSLSGKTLATEDHNPPKPPQPVGTSAPVTQMQTVGVGVEQNTQLTSITDVDLHNQVNTHLTVKPQIDIHQAGPTVNLGGVVVNEGPTEIKGSTSSSTLNLAPGAIAPVANGGAGGQGGQGGQGGAGGNATGGNATGGSVTLAPGAVAPKAEATVGDVKTGDNHNKVEVDSHDKNINVTLVPPGLPSLAPAPMIQECTACRIDFSFSYQEMSGSTTAVMPQVIKGKDLSTDKDSYLTMTSGVAFTGVAKKPTGVQVLMATANRVPPEVNFSSVAMITAQADGKNAHKVTIEELQIRVYQAALRLKFSPETVLYTVCSRKATTLHPTLVTTGKGFSFAPGLAGEALGGMGGLTANLGRSSGTATNDFTPEISCIVLKPNTVGVKGELVGALDYQGAQAVSANK